MAYADYTYYTDTFLGTAVKESDFPRLALRASSYLDYYTMGKAAKNAGLDALKMARARGIRVETGVFGAHMKVSLVNDGPVTIWVDSKMRDC